MKKKENEITNKQILERIEQAKEMNVVWEESNETVKAYLKGCMSTAAALAGGKKAG